MKRFLGAALLVTVLALAAACGSGGGEEQPAGGMGGGGDAQEGQAPPMAESIRVDADGDTIDEVIDATAVATPTAESVPAAADLREQLGELVLDEGDVPGSYRQMGSGSFDSDFSQFADVPGSQYLAEAEAQYSLFLHAGGKRTIMSLVMLMENDELVSQAIASLEEVGFQDLSEAFRLGAGLAGVTLSDVHTLDASDLGDGGFGSAATIDMQGMASMSMAMIMFGDGPVMGMVTVSAGAGEVSDRLVRSLAETMADKIEAAVQ